jgi:exoribonuclease R
VLDLLVDLEAGGTPQPEAIATLARLPKTMEESESRAGQVERAIVDDLEARLLEHRVGELFEAAVVEHDARGARLQIAEPPVRARLRSDHRIEPGTMLAVRLVAADPVGRSLRFAPA